jgi:uncharacterized protein (TIGR02271 family)
MFNDRTSAEAAVSQLMQALGLGSNQAQIHAADRASVTSSAPDVDPWSSLVDLSISDDDRQAYAEGIRRGRVVVSADVEESLIDQAADILEYHGALDLDAQEAEWRHSGWTGAQTGITAEPTMVSAPADAEIGLVSTGTSGGAVTAGSSTVPAAASATTSRIGSEEVIPIVEERIRVGKRDVERGRVRVRSYIVETAVSEQVTLRQEHVEVQRRAVDRPVADAENLFQERTIEAVEHAEEAIVAKEARVTEELVIRKEAGEHIETVSDTVRRTEVEIDDTTGTNSTVPEAATVTGSTTTDPSGTVASRTTDGVPGTNTSGTNPSRKA